MTEKEIAHTVSAMRSMVERQKTFVWPIPSIDVDNLSDEFIDQLVPHPLLRFAGWACLPPIHRNDFTTMHDAWIEQTKEQLFIDKLLARVAEVELQMKTNKHLWSVTIMEEFAQFILANK